MDHGFVDLSDADITSDHASFWPSFTDIMMVVMMIFMLTSVVLIMRNWELVAELRATMAAEQQAAEMARVASETNATLEERLAQAQHQLSELRMQLMQAQEADQLKSQLLAEREQSLQRVTRERAQLQSDLTASRQRTAQLDTQVSQQQQQITSLSTQLSSSLEKVATLEHQYRQSSDELLRLQRKEEQAALARAQLQNDYSQLKVKYDKLVKPARSARGKYVVEVRYEKISGSEKITFKSRDDKGYRSLDRATLKRELNELKKRYPKQLYVKIIIPAESGLSYSEAWDFMKNLLDKYDYYYQ